MKTHLNSDSEDIDDVLKVIEKSYNISFIENELSHVETFGELCNEIVSKINLQDMSDCSTQQAFYKLRKAIVDVQEIDKFEIQIPTELNSIFVRKNRRNQIKKIEAHLGFKIKVLRAKYVITSLLVFSLISSLFLFYFDWKIATIILFTSIVLLKISEKFGIEFTERTIGQLTNKITRENYLKSRRNPSTVNKKEIVKLIEKLFIENLGLENDFKEIPPETIIIERKHVG